MKLLGSSRPPTNIVALKQLAEIELATRHGAVRGAEVLLRPTRTMPRSRRARPLFVSAALEVMATAGWARLGQSAGITES